MKTETINKLLIGAFIILAVTCLSFGLYGIHTQHQINERFKMIDHQKGDWLNGAYFKTDDYYCVWTKGRTPDEIAKTAVHEQCHALVAADYNHFCKGVIKQKN